MRRFKEGGNLTVSGYDGERRSATKIQVGKMNQEQFNKFKQDFVTFLMDLSDEFKKFSGRPIWEEGEEEKLIDELMSGNFYSGSTRPMFQQPLDKYSAKKPKVGDFDVQVPEEIQEDFRKFMDERATGLQLGNIKIYGIKNGLDQSHALVQFLDYPDLGADYAQIDFEYVEFSGSKPSEFSTFGHYSSWEDIEHNVKGAFQKLLLRAICHVADLRDIIIVSNKTGKPLRAANKRALKNMLAFSVTNGVRVKYKPTLDEDGNQVYIDGKEAWEEVPTSESNYLRTIKEIFERIFGEAPSNDADVKALYSYVRTVKLFKRYFTKDKVEDILMQFIDLIWGPQAQKLSAFDKQEDIDWKDAAYNEFVNANNISQSIKDEIAELRKDYYSRYEERQRADDEG